MSIARRHRRGGPGQGQDEDRRRESFHHRHAAISSPSLQAPAAAAEQLATCVSSAAHADASEHDAKDAAGEAVDAAVDAVTYDKPAGGSAPAASS